MKIFRRISCPKVLLWMSNMTLLGCACALVAVGGLLFVDNRKMLLSKLLGVTNESLVELPKPLFYYAAVGLAGCGLVGLFAAILGFWANCWTNYCTLTLYFLVVFILLIAEFVASVSLTIWPNCLGLNLEEDGMVRALTGQYGIPGHEQFTAAIDLAQTQFQCCGISTDINYDTSFWLLQSYARKGLTVPLTCCALDNAADEQTAYLDPKPTNLTLCQALQRSDYSQGRHLRSCLEEIQVWYNWHYILFIGISSIVALVNFFVLLTIIYSCTNLKRVRQRSIDQHIAEFERKVNDRRNILTVAASSSSTRSSPLPLDDAPDSIPAFEYNNSNGNKPRNMSTFRTSYRGGNKAYLV